MKSTANVLGNATCWVAVRKGVTVQQLAERVQSMGYQLPYRIENAIDAGCGECRTNLDFRRAGPLSEYDVARLSYVEW